jgi:excisionase family DNA binding protein
MEVEQNQDYSNWMTKRMAAKVIGVSTKTIQDMAGDGKLQSVRWRDPKGGAWMKLYCPTDVERVCEERKQDCTPPFITRQSEPDSARSLAKANGASPGSLNAVLEAFQEAYTRPRITEMIFLSLDDASELSQLPRRHLRRLIATGKLNGLKTGKGWRIRRVDLDKL